MKFKAINLKFYQVLLTCDFFNVKKKLFKTKAVNISNLKIYKRLIVKDALITLSLFKQFLLFLKSHFISRKDEEVRIHLRERIRELVIKISKIKDKERKAFYEPLIPELAKKIILRPQNIGESSLVLKITNRESYLLFTKFLKEEGVFLFKNDEDLMEHKMIQIMNRLCLLGDYDFKHITRENKIKKYTPLITEINTSSKNRYIGQYHISADINNFFKNFFLIGLIKKFKNYATKK